MRDYRVLKKKNECGLDATQRPDSGQRGQLQAISFIDLDSRLIHPNAVGPHHLEGRVDDLTRASAWRAKCQTP